MFTPGLVSISFRSLTPEDILQNMVKAELFAVEWGSDVHAPAEDIPRLRKIAALQKQYGITCCSYGTYFKFGQNDVAELEQYFAAAKILGADILRLWCGTRSYLDYTASEKAELFAQCRKAAAMAEAHGMTLCMECHPKTFTDELQGALELMDAVNHPNFRMYWQPNQHKPEAEKVAYATAIAPYTTHLHVFQWQEKEKFPLETGKENWKTYLSAFSGHHYLLLEFMPDNDPASLPREAETLRTIIGEQK